MTIFKHKTLTALAAFLLTTVGASAQDAQGGVSEQDLLLALITTMIVVSLVSLLLVFTIMVLVRQKRAEQTATTEERATEEVAETATPAFSWTWIKDKLTDAVPVEKENSIDMGHNYDGIRELDNNLPPWWKYGFYLSILFAVLYLGYYHVFSDWSSEQEYVAAMEEHQEIRSAYLARQADMVNEESVSILADATALNAGKQIYQTNCTPCHGADGGGNAIGPNLADEYWIHGGSIKDVFSTIKYGVIEKGMTPWQDILKPLEMQQVASYIMEEIQGSTPADPKEPQGELYAPSEEDAAEPADSTSVAMVN